MTRTERGFRLVFWGLVFVVLDIHLDESVNLLPDFVGFILVTVGLGRLVTLSGRFRAARVLAAMLIVLSLADFSDLVREEGAPWLDGWRVLEIFVDVVDVAMVWLLCGGIVALAKAHELPDLRYRAETRRGLYVGFQVASWIVLFAMKDAPEPPVALFVGMFVFAVVVMLLLMGLMLRAGRELGEVA